MISQLVQFLCPLPCSPETQPPKPTNRKHVFDSPKQQNQNQNHVFNSQANHDPKLPHNPRVSVFSPNDVVFVVVRPHQGERELSALRAPNASSILEPSVIYNGARTRSVPGTESLPQLQNGVLFQAV